MPGHGRVCDQFDVVEYRDMVTIVRDRVRDLIKAGMTLDQIKAASPARGYTRRYGSDSGPWTTNNFVEAVYTSLVQGEAVRAFRLLIVAFTVAVCACSRRHAVRAQNRGETPPRANR